MNRERWMAVFFASGSLCFLVGPFPGYAQLVGAAADAATFFVGSILFTAGGALQTWLSYGERHAPGSGRAAWRAAVVQSALETDVCRAWKVVTLKNRVPADWTTAARHAARPLPGAWRSP